MGTDLLVSSTLALDATQDLEYYAAESGRAQFCTSLLWSRKRAEAARVRWPSDLQSRRSRTMSGSNSSRRIHKARYTPPRGCRLSEAATSLNSLGVLALPYVGQRNDHQDALGSGLGVTEFAPQDTRQLWRWVSEKLVEGSLDMSKTRIMRPASDIRPARRSLMELTAAASRAIDDALLVTSNARN